MTINRPMSISERRPFIVGSFIENLPKTAVMFYPGKRIIIIYGLRESILRDSGGEHKRHSTYPPFGLVWSVL